jgi:ribosome biogenesis GTPase A
MPILWYPGHMVAARKDAAEAMRSTDHVIEVLDARVPHASCNPVVETLRKKSGRPALKLLNKADLADPEVTRAWLAYYNDQPGVRAIVVSAKEARDVSRIPKEARSMVPGRGRPAKPLRMMILGVPNVGKSTLMNALLKRHVAAVGDQPAITKMHMGHALGDDMWLVDTPGLLWPGLSQDRAVKLAITHAIGINAYDNQEVAAVLGRYALDHYRPLLVKRYGELPAGCDGHGLIAFVAESRQLLMKDGVPDLNKAALVLLNEFRSGTWGQMSIETVEEVGGAANKPTTSPATPPASR